MTSAYWRCAPVTKIAPHPCGCVPTNVQIGHSRSKTRPTDEPNPSSPNRHIPLRLAACQFTARTAMQTADDQTANDYYFTRRPRSSKGGRFCVAFLLSHGPKLTPAERRPGMLQAGVVANLMSWHELSPGDLRQTYVIKERARVCVPRILRSMDRMSVCWSLIP